MVGGMAMRKLAVLVLAFTLAGTGFSQQTHKTPDPEAINLYIEWCEKSWNYCKELDWKQCREMRLQLLSVERECLERSQSEEAFRECIVYFLLRIGRGT
jgi:hypothetical protein